MTARRRRCLCDGATEPRERDRACTRYINARRRYWVVEEEGKRQKREERVTAQAASVRAGSTSQPATRAGRPALPLRTSTALPLRSRVEQQSRRGGMELWSSSLGGVERARRRAGASRWGHRSVARRRGAGRSCGQVVAKLLPSSASWGAREAPASQPPGPDVLARAATRDS